MLVGLLIGLLMLGGLVSFNQQRRSESQKPGDRVVPPPCNAERALAYLEQLCAIGPRKSGSDGMRRQQEELTRFFSDRGLTVELQRFNGHDPESGTPVELANLIARWRPEREERILIAAHYDTRPYPDQDPRQPRGKFVGANDGASGVAVLMELAHHLDQLPGSFGVDLICFDGEELVYDGSRDPYFLGSTHFANAYVQQPPPYRYRNGILLDMVGDRSQEIFYERYSLQYARELTLSLWKTAERIGAQSFEPRARHYVRDDHLPLNQIARIPTCDVIDFDYPRPGSGPKHWHTTSDTPDKCSGESLATVGSVVFHWLTAQP
jgi:hypothetical protein